MRTNPRPRKALSSTLLLTVLATIAMLTACGGSTSNSSGSSASVGTQVGTPDQAAGAAGSAPSTAPKSGSSAAPLQQRDIVRTGTITVAVIDIDRAANDASQQAVSAGGRVDGDQRAAAGSDRTATLTLRVPPERWDGLLAGVVKLGHERDRSVKGEDVTTARADVNARVAALQTSIARLKEFLSRSGSISDLVSLENQLTTREADLASTVAQQRALTDQVSLATLTVSLVQPAAVTAKAKSGPQGFGSALARGWHGLTLTVRWLLALLGYVLPVGLVLAVIAVGTVLLARRLRPNTVVEEVEPTPVS